MEAENSGTIQRHVEVAASGLTTNHAPTGLMDNCVVEIREHEVACLNVAAMGEINQRNKPLAALTPHQACSYSVDQA